MPEDVRRYPFVFEAGARSLGDRLAKQQMDGEAGQRFSTDAGKCDGCWLCLEFAEPLLQDLRGAWPERDHAVLPAFSVQLDIAFRGDRDLVALESGDLRDTSLRCCRETAATHNLACRATGSYRWTRGWPLSLRASGRDAP